MVKVVVHNKDELEKALKRFKSQCKKEGILKECKERKFYAKPSARRRLERNKRK